MNCHCYCHQKAVGLEKACSWDQPPSNIAKGDWEKLATLYDSPSDIDLFTGGLAEKLVEGWCLRNKVKSPRCPYVRFISPDGNVGLTFGHIIASQFDALRSGDRFFFTHEDGASAGFSPGQLENLRRRRLGDVICDNSGIPATLEKVLRADSGFQACSYRRKENDIKFELFA